MHSIPNFLCIDLSHDPHLGEILKFLGACTAPNETETPGKPTGKVSKYFRSLTSFYIRRMKASVMDLSEGQNSHRLTGLRTPEDLLFVDDQELAERFRIATEAADIGVWDIDLRSGILTWDAKMHALFEVSEAKFGGLFEDWQQRVHPDDVDAATENFNQAIESNTLFDDQFRIVTPSGKIKHVRARAQVFTAPDGVPIRAVGVNYDVSQKEFALEAAERAAEKADLANARTNRLTSNVPAGLFEYREAPDGTISFPFFNKRLPEMLGVSTDQIKSDGASAFQHLHPDDVGQVIEEIGQSRKNLTPYNVRYRIQHPQIGLRWYKASTIPMREPDGATIWYGSLIDISADVEKEASLRKARDVADQMRRLNEHQALHDGLTGLPNRRFYDQTLCLRMLNASETHNASCTLIRIDLDHFKHVNDSLGHDAGDSVLNRVAEVLKASIDETDFGARIGGDEFSIIVGPGKTVEDAKSIVADIQQQLAKPHLYRDRQCRFGASFGLAHTDQLSIIRNDIQMFADAALYKAKSSGRNRLEIFTPSMHETIISDRKLAVELQDGLENDEFVPYFQPQVDADGGHLTGVEVLLRWNHPTRGVLCPPVFMHVGEQLRLVPELDRRMLEKCQGAMLNWAAEGLVVPKMSFNVSAGRLEDPAIVEEAERLAKLPISISFELLESILIEDEQDTRRFHIDQIRQAGIDIEVDDFGSGHASVVSLIQVQPSCLKIDRRLIAPIETDKKSRNLVKAIIEMAKVLGIQTIAEGIEQEGQAEILRKLGCDMMQGFLFGKAMRQDAFTTLASTLAESRAA